MHSLMCVCVCDNPACTNVTWTIRFFLHWRELSCRQLHRMQLSECGFLCKSSLLSFSSFVSYAFCFVLFLIFIITSLWCFLFLLRMMMLIDYVLKLKLRWFCDAPAQSKAKNWLCMSIAFQFLFRREKVIMSIIVGGSAGAFEDHWLPWDAENKRYVWRTMLDFTVFKEI